MRRDAYGWLTLLALLVATSATANSTRATRGDAEAVFSAFGGGGWAIRLHSGQTNGAPADFMPDSAVRIGHRPEYDGRHYCALDWHVIVITIVAGSGPDDSISNEEIRDQMADISAVVLLDGTALETERTAPKRTTNPEFVGFEDAFFANVGRIMWPEDLEIGPHNVVFIGQIGSEPPEIIGDNDFFIDAPGTGVCVADALTFREVE